MTSVLARLGHIEARIASQIAWRPGKRKRQEWRCWECRARKVRGEGANVMGRRGYAGGDGGDIKVSVGDFLGTDNVWGERGRDEGAKDERSREQQVPRIRREDVAFGRGRAQSMQWGAYNPDSEIGTAQYHPNTPIDARDQQLAWSSSGEDQAAEHESAQNELWESFEHAEEQVEEAAAASEEDNQTGKLVHEPHVALIQNQDSALAAMRLSPLLDIDYAALLPDAVKKRETDLVARCLFAACRDDNLAFIRAIPPGMFSEILEVLEPANSVDKLASAHLEISDAMRKQLGISSMQQVAYEYSNLVKEVVGVRQAAGLFPTSSDYHILLRSARDLGNFQLVEALWKNLQFQGHTPDVEHYNYYMAGRVFHGVHDPAGRHRLRVIPFYMMARKAKRLGAQFQSYRVGDGGLKDAILSVFREMLLKNRATANEESFRIVITAAAREGDLSTVKSVLRKVWGIDVDALIAGTPEKEITPKQLPSESPQHPTPRLLFTLAHAFGINNDIPTALRLVDFVARRFNLTIDQQTWAQLFEWTFVLATPRTGTDRRNGANAGSLPLQSVMSLWTTMMGEPYFIKPTMGMYNRLIRNLTRRDMTPAIMEKMNEGRELYRESRTEAFSRWRALRKGIRDSRTAKPDQLAGVQSSLRAPEGEESLEHLRREWEYADLIRKRNLFWCKRWLRLLLKTTPATSRFDGTGTIALRWIPNVLLDWKEFASTIVSYEVFGGLVEFPIRTKEEIEARGVKGKEEREERERWLGKVPRYVGEEWVRERVSRKSDGDSGTLESLLRAMSGAEGNGDDVAAAEADANREDEEGLRKEVREAVDQAIDGGWTESSTPEPVKS